jgi:type IV pilus assembly protein PilE
MQTQKQRGFTVIELMIVVVIVAILLSIGLPSYQQQLQKARRTLGRAELMEVMARQEQFFLNHRQYAAALTDLGYPASPYAIGTDGNDGPATAAGRIYLIEISTLPVGFALFAIPQLTQSRDRLCGTLSLTSAGVKTATGSASPQECW